MTLLQHYKHLFSVDKKKVLLHHPDKRKAAGKTINKDDDYFTCITKGNPPLPIRHKVSSYFLKKCLRTRTSARFTYCAHTTKALVIFAIT